MAWRHGVVWTLLVTTRKGRWSIPKGRVMRGQTLRDAAEAEALEEAGVIGHALLPVIGTYEHEKRGQTHHVSVFPMIVGTVLADWKERRERSRRWVALRDAPSLIEVAGPARIVHGSLDVLDRLGRCQPDAARELAAG